jgi:hypothetical protein
MRINCNAERLEKILSANERLREVVRRQTEMLKNHQFPKLAEGEK